MKTENLRSKWLGAPFHRHPSHFLTLLMSAFSLTSSWSLVPLPELLYTWPLQTILFILSFSLVIVNRRDPFIIDSLFHFSSLSCYPLHYRWLLPGLLGEVITTSNLNFTSLWPLLHALHLTFDAWSYLSLEPINLELFPKDGVISHLIIELRSHNLIVYLTLYNFLSCRSSWYYTLHNLLYTFYCHSFRGKPAIS